MRKWYIVFCIIFLIDRLVKFFIISNQNLETYLINNLVGIKLLKNTDVFFGLSNKIPFFNIFICLILLSLIFLLIKIWQEKNYILFSGILLIILGGFSNITDRLIYGYVIDMIYIGISIWNLADAMILAGFILAGYELLIKNDKKNNYVADKRN